MTTHDALFKRFLSLEENAKDFLDAHLPEAIKAYCDLASIRTEPTSLIEPKLRQHYSDILYAVKIRNKPGYIYTLIEHQSTPDKLMAFRMLRYKVSIMQRHLEKNNTTKLPIVVPLLFYAGRLSPYPHSLDIMECFEETELARTIMSQALILIDVTIMSDNEILKHKKVALLEMIQKHIFNRDIIILVKQMVKALQVANHPKDVFQDVLEYVLNNKDIESYHDFLGRLVEEVEQYEEDTMNIAERLRQEGARKGKEQGMQQGMQQREQAIVKNMLAKQLPVSLIQEITGLSEAEIEKLALS